MTKALAILAALALAAPPPDQTCSAAKVDKLPTVDGKADDPAWAKAKELVVKVDKTDNLDEPKETCSLKVVHDGDSACFLLVWADDAKNDTHGTLVWKDNAGEYEEDPNDMEDMVALAFSLEGAFDPDMRAFAESKWDVWEWRAYRANAGVAADRIFSYSKTKTDKAKSLRHPKSDSPVYLTRAHDAGTPPFKAAPKPEEKKGDKIPGFLPQAAAGSCADVAAKAVWADGKWTVEFRRKLKTGNPDDAVFEPGKSVAAAVSVFNNTEKSDHSVSGKVVLSFEK